MRVAFYAPLKAPDHPVPSGDRRMARAFFDLAKSLGHEVSIASRFRSYDRDGDPMRQRRLAAVADRCARPISRWTKPPEFWLSYHCYHKAPDLLGPHVTSGLDIPYLIAEPSFGAKQADGPWAGGHQAAARAFAAADLLLAMTEDDLAGVAPLARPPARAVLFPPFIDMAPIRRATAARKTHRAALAQNLHLDPRRPWLLTVAMMRPDVKRQSYLALARMLEPLRPLPWQLVVAGDGEARGEIEQAFGEALPGRARFLGSVAPLDLDRLYAAADLYVWPAFREAYGVAILEAQAAGLPVVAFREGGVGDIVLDGETGTLIAARQELEFIATVRMLLVDPERRRAMGAAAAANAMARHDVSAARDRFASAMDEACSIRARRRRGG
jgi:glycosyltransferase involved in cell wall biosynthesis